MQIVFDIKTKIKPCACILNCGIYDINLAITSPMLFNLNKKIFEDTKRRLENAAKTMKKKSAKRLQETLERLKEAEKAEEKVASTREAVVANQRNPRAARA